MFKQTHILTGTAFVLWAALIFLCYGNNFSFPGGHYNFVLDEILFGLTLILISLLSGNRFLKIFHLDGISVLEEVLFSVGVGLGLLSISIFMLGLFQLLYPWTLAILLMGFCLLALSNYDYGRVLWRKAKNWHPSPSLSELLIILLIFSFAGLTFINTLTPPVSRDGLIHHLAIPK